MRQRRLSASKAPGSAYFLGHHGSSGQLAAMESNTGHDSQPDSPSSAAAAPNDEAAAAGGGFGTPERGPSEREREQDHHGDRRDMDVAGPTGTHRVHFGGSVGRWGQSYHSNGGAALKHRRRQCWEPIDPRSLVMRRWDGFIACLLVFVMIVSPFEVSRPVSGSCSSFCKRDHHPTVSRTAFLPVRAQVGFLRVDPDWFSPLFWVNRLVDVGFLIDLVLNFNLMYYDSDAARWISKHGAIVRHYVASGYVLVDLVSCVPFDMISTIHNSNQNADSVRAAPHGAPFVEPAAARLPPYTLAPALPLRLPPNAPPAAGDQHPPHPAPAEAHAHAAPRPRAPANRGPPRRQLQCAEISPVFPPLFPSPALSVTV